jgi:hypothetical protein
MKDQTSTTKPEVEVEENKIEETKPDANRDYAIGYAKEFLSDIGCW